MTRVATLAGLLMCFVPAYLLGWAVAAVRRGWSAGRTDLHRTVAEVG